jgi:YesN/AraC family two-component response regulator
MFYENSSKNKLSNAVLEAMLLLFLSRLVQKCEDSLQFIRTSNNDDSRGTVDDILLYIHEHLCDVTLDDIADKFHFNKYYVSRLIKNHTEITFTQLVRKIRMLEAKKMIASTTLSLSKICEIVGYSDTSNLVKTFKKEFGITPNQYRKELQNNQHMT